MHALKTVDNKQIINKRVKEMISSIRKDLGFSIYKNDIISFCSLGFSYIFSLKNEKNILGDYKCKRAALIK